MAPTKGELEENLQAATGTNEVAEDMSPLDDEVSLNELQEFEGWEMFVGSLRRWGVVANPEEELPPELEFTPEELEAGRRSAERAAFSELFRSAVVPYDGQSLGRWLRAVRIKQGLSPAEVGRLFGLSEAEWLDIELKYDEASRAAPALISDILEVFGAPVARATSPMLIFICHGAGATSAAAMRQLWRREVSKPLRPYLCEYRSALLRHIGRLWDIPSLGRPAGIPTMLSPIEHHELVLDSLQGQFFTPFVETGKAALESWVSLLGRELRQQQGDSRDDGTPKFLRSDVLSDQADPELEVLLNWRADCERFEAFKTWLEAVQAKAPLAPPDETYLSLTPSSAGAFSDDFFQKRARGTATLKDEPLLEASECQHGIFDGGVYPKSDNETKSDDERSTARGDPQKMLRTLVSAMTEIFEQQEATVRGKKIV